MRRSRGAVLMHDTVAPGASKRCWPRHSWWRGPRREANGSGRKGGSDSEQPGTFCDLLPELQAWTRSCLPRGVPNTASKGTPKRTYRRRSSIRFPPRGARSGRGCTARPSGSWGCSCRPCTAGAESFAGHGAGDSGEGMERRVRRVYRGSGAEAEAVTRLTGGGRTETQVPPHLTAVTQPRSPSRNLPQAEHGPGAFFSQHSTQ